MIPCTDEEAGILPFHQWKSALYTELQTKGEAYEKEWYYTRYGGYCNQMRRAHVERQQQLSDQANLPDHPES